MTKPFSEFKKAVIAKYKWNSAMGFWAEFVYEQYKRGRKTWEAAIDTMKSFSGYTGV